MSSGNNLLGDDKYTEYGNDHDYRLKYNSSSNRWEIVDPSGNVLLHVTDAGTTGNLGVTGNLAVSGATTLSGALTASITDSGTNTVIQGPAWFHKSSGAPASGLGISIILGADNASHTLTGAVELHGYLTTVTAGSEVGAYKIRLIYNGANQDAFTITPGTNTTTITSGQTTLNCFNTVATTVNAFGAATTIATCASAGGAATWTHGGNVAGQVDFRICAQPGNFSSLTFSKYSSSAVRTRWLFGANNASESGSDAGSNFTILAYTDAGGNIDTPFSITRASGGAITIARPLVGAATQSVFNTTSTTINAFGAASVLNMGVAAGLTTISGNVLVTDGANNNLGILRVQPTASDQASIGLRCRASGPTSSNRDWKLAINQVTNGDFHIMRSTSAGGNATTSVMSFDSSSNATFVGAIIGAATQSLLDTVSTTINFGAAASIGINIGNTAGPITFAGIVVAPASTTSRASLRAPHGTAPTSPADGDFWTDASGAYIRINGVTKTFTLT